MTPAQKHLVILEMNRVQNVGQKAHFREFYLNSEDRNWNVTV